MNLPFDPNERIFTWSDVKRLYIRLRKRLYRWALAGALFSFLCFGIRTPGYKVEASFKEGVEKGDSAGALKELLGGVSLAAQQPQAASLMKSRQVLKALVQKLGLNVTFPRTGWLLPKVIRRYRDNLRAERGLPLNDLDPFVFQDVLYEQQEPLSLSLRFLDEEHFIVHTGDKQGELARAVLGAEVELPELAVKFTLLKAPQGLKSGVYYSFTIDHWLPAAEGLKKSLNIASDKLNKSIYDIAVVNRDRHLAVRILNTLMEEYQKYLKREYDQLAREQLNYLENKQGQLYAKLGGLLDENVDYLARNIEKNGFLNATQESDSFLLSYQQMHDKSQLIEVELARLDSLEKPGKTVPLMEEGYLASGIRQLFEKIQELKQQRDLLELSLCQFNQEFVSLQRGEIQEVRQRRLAVEALLSEVDGGGQLVAGLDIHPGLVHWAKAVRTPDEQEDFAEYLENYARLLSLRENMLQERLFYGADGPSELQGIDSATARALFVEYNNKLDAAQAKLKNYAEFKKEIERPQFELATLSSFLTDPLSEKIISDATLLGLKVKDEKYHSSKEGKRHTEEIGLQKKILSDHLDQLAKVEELNASLIREKMRGLQKINLEAINQQISVLHEQANDSIKERRKALSQEKNILQKRMKELRSQTVSLPEKWRLEKWLELKTETTSRIMETVTEVVESKTIAHHLHHVESKPLDKAILPRGPVSPLLKFKILVGAFLFPFLFFFFALLRQIWIGFPTSLEKMQALRLPSLGSISAFCDGPAVELTSGPDLELLRKLVLFTDNSRVIALLSGVGPDYSYALGENFARIAKKSIVLRCDFLSKFRKEDGPGLLQIWKGELGDLPIRKGKGFDYISAGGYTPFGAEILQSPRFTQLVELLKKNYDQVFLLLRSPLSSTESAAILRHSEKAIVTVSGEKIEELTPFILWAYHEDRCRLTFVAHS